MFKLLKFIDEYKTFQRHSVDFSLAKLGQATKAMVRRQDMAEHLSVFENLFLLTSKFSSTIFFILDNTNLLLESAFGRHHPHKRVIKRWKDWFNLIRNWFQLFRSIMKMRRAHNNI